MKFTDRQIKNLKPRAHRFEVWEGNGLGVRVTPKGTKTWVFLYRFGDRARRMTLGEYPAMTVAQAHEAHGRALAELERGNDPGAAAVQERREERIAPTVAALVAEYLEKWAKPRKRSWEEDQRILEKDVLPVWGRRKAREITRRDVIALLDDIVERGAPIVANRTLEIIRKMFNFALERDIITATPCALVRAPAAETQRDRVLNEDEIRAFWRGLDAARMDEGTQLALKLQLLSAQRRGEVLSAEWSEFDLAGGWWTIPAGKSKNRLAHRVPLSNQALALLERAESLACGSRYVFPSPRRSGGDKPVAVGAVTRALGRSRTALGIEHFTPHDLRRTAASHMTGMGISRLVVSKILNHVESGITAVYDRHSYDQEKRQALDAWGHKLESIVTGSGTAGNVVPIKRTG
ncbi:MAG: tyrosine-type recombinase/integrase [Pseudomonadota bacterium]|nr:tyrosine-type recombinase/integrase [Pseudomonadota bacterium]